MSSKRMDNWLARNKERFGTQDGLPDEFHRKSLFALIKPHAKVGIITPHGSRLTGRVIMKGPAGWVIAIDGSRHGQPAIASPENTIWVSGAVIP